MSINYYSRLELATRSDDLSPGIAAPVYDPAWLLARQWQLGELIGNDGGTPIGVRHTGDVLMVEELSAGGGPAVPLDQRPWEAQVEATPVRPVAGWSRWLQVETGRELVAQLRAHGIGARAAAVVAAFPLAAPAAGADPDTPEAGFTSITAGRAPDGEAAYEHWASGLRQVPPQIAPVAGVTVDDALRDALVAWLAFCDAVVVEPATDAWDPARFLHRCRLGARGTAASVDLRADAHPGGGLDWWAFDAKASAGDPAGESLKTDTEAAATRVQFRGMPNPRWWEIEDAAVDFGSVEANPADLARMALLEFALVYGNDHFAIPVRLPVGSLCRTTNLLVTDTFGVTLEIAPAAVASSSVGRTAHGSTRWTMFSLTNTAGGVAEWFCLPATATDEVTSAPVEDLLCARDEMANVAWAIERFVEGPTGEAVDRGREFRAPPALAPPGVDHSTLRWVFGSTVPPFWFPLVIDPADPSVFEVQNVGSAPVGNAPRGTLLRLGARIATDAVPREGRRLRREFVAARGADGSTAVWSRRRANVGRGESSSGLAFDRAEPVSAEL